MSTVEEIKAAIESLPKGEYTELREWFAGRDWEDWDRQLDEDVQEGRLGFLVREALDEKVRGGLKEL